MIGPLKQQAARFIVNQKLKEHKFDELDFSRIIKRSYSYLVIMPKDEKDFRFAVEVLNYLKESKKNVNAMTDVTGFGLLGHLTEICQGSGVSAEIKYLDVPKIENIEYYLDRKTAPGGTLRNWNSYKHEIAPMDPDWINLLADPQTSGGLLISVDENRRKEFEDFMNLRSLKINPFGRIIDKSDYLVKVN